MACVQSTLALCDVLLEDYFKPVDVSVRGVTLALHVAILDSAKSSMATGAPVSTPRCPLSATLLAMRKVVATLGKFT
jgi:hypothetical protein